MKGSTNSFYLQPNLRSVCCTCKIPWFSPWSATYIFVYLNTLTALKNALELTNTHPKVKMECKLRNTDLPKVSMTNKCCFKDMDFRMMFHPYPENLLKLTTLFDLNATIVTYKGHVTALCHLHPGKEQMLWMQLSWLMQTSVCWGNSWSQQTVCMTYTSLHNSRKDWVAVWDEISEQGGVWWIVY